MSSSRRHRDDFDAYCPRLLTQVFIVGETCFSPTSSRAACSGCRFDNEHLRVKLLRVLSGSLATTERGKRKIEINGFQKGEGEP